MDTQKRSAVVEGNKLCLSSKHEEKKCVPEGKTYVH